MSFSGGSISPCHRVVIELVGICWRQLAPPSYYPHALVTLSLLVRHCLFAGAELQATNRLPRWRIGERPSDIKVSCEISGHQWQWCQTHTHTHTHAYTPCHSPARLAGWSSPAPYCDGLQTSGHSFTIPSRCRKKVII